MRTIRVSRDTKEYRKEARVAKDIKANEYLAEVQRIKKVHINQERCVCL